MPSPACSRAAANVGRSRGQHSLKLDSPDSSGVWATLPFAEAVVTKSSNGLMLPQWLAAEPQRVVFSLTPFSAASPGFDATSMYLSACADRKLSSIQRWRQFPRNQDTKSNLARLNIVSSPSCGVTQPRRILKIKPFMSAYLSAWEMRLTQGTVHSAMRSGPRPCTTPTLHRHFSSASNGVRASVCVCWHAQSQRPPSISCCSSRSIDKISGHGRGREARKDNNA